MQMITELERDSLKAYEEINLRRLTGWFQQGCKQKENSKIGLELEHFVVDADTMRAVPYDGDRGMETVLESVSPHFPRQSRERGKLLAMANEDYSLSLEPGAQLEISISPKREIFDIDRVYHSFLKCITPALDAFGYQLVCSGYQPVSKAAEVSLIPKERYRIMDDYFTLTGTMGKNMMRGTASVQLNIDYFSQADFVRKYKLANLLIPVVFLLTDNCSYFEGTRNKKSCIRSFIWEHVDEKRCAIACKERFDTFSFGKYAEWIYASLPLFQGEGENVSYTKANRAYFSERKMTDEEIRHALSMVFPQVRLKHFLELRMADSMPLPYTLSYTAFIKGIFSSETSIQKALEVLPGQTPAEVLQAVRQIRGEAFDGEVYGNPVSETLDKLFQIAEDSLSAEEKVFLPPLKNLSSQKMNLRLQESCVKSGK